jgi:hypothetical protein
MIYTHVLQRNRHGVRSPFDLEAGSGGGGDGGRVEELAEAYDAA